MVGIDLGEKPDTVRRFRDNHRLTYPVLMDPNKLSFPRLKHGFAIPNNVVIDRQGVVRYSRAGFCAKELEKTVTELLAESPPASAPQSTRVTSP